MMIIDRRQITVQFHFTTVNGCIVESGELLAKAARHICHIEGVGQVLLERSRRARRINISIKPFKGIRVAVPCSITFSRAKAFTASQKTWIKKHLGRIQDIEQAHAMAADRFRDIDKTQAGKVLRQRLDALATRHGFKYNRVFIRNQKTRWGSCSAKNNISLNVKLTRLPEILMDYIILHELVHTRIKNHSKGFYTELERITGNRSELDAELKTYEIGLLEGSTGPCHSGADA